MRSAAEYGVTSTPFDKLRALSTRRAVSAHAVSPALVSPPRTPPHPRRPLSKKEILRGGKPIPASPPLRGGAAGSNLETRK